MTSISDEFGVGGTQLRWGTTLAEAMDALAALPRLKSSGDSARFVVEEACGLAALSTELRGPALDRPVLQVAHELKHIPQRASDDAVLSEVTGVFGPPGRTETNLPVRPDHPSYSVTAVAHWQFGDVSVGLSIYGAPRTVQNGVSSAGLYADWDNIVAAAEPYLQELEAAEARLASYATEIELLDIVTIEEPLRPYYVPDYGSSDPHHVRNDETLRRAQICLRKRNLCRTPESVGRTLDDQRVAVWKSTSHGMWGVSTRWETVYFPLGAPVRVGLVSLLPAKFGGSTELTVSDLQLCSVARSAAIHQLADLLKANSLADVDYSEFYDA